MAEEGTAHHVRRLHASIRDLQYALGVLGNAERPPRPSRDAISPDTAASDDPRSRIAANNERGVVQRIERLEESGAVVLGLEGVGALVADALCRYGVRRLVVGDTAVLSPGDLDYMTYYVHNLGVTRESHVAATARRLNPDVDVFALRVPLNQSHVVVESLRGMLERSDDSDGGEDEGSGGLVESDNDGMSGGSDCDSGGTDVEESSERRVWHDPRGEVYDVNGNSDDERCFSVVFLCGNYPELAMALNELCCEYAVQFVYVTTGRNGLSGDTLSVIPGRSACLQCLEKRKVLKIASNFSAENDHAEGRPQFSISLPTTDCVLAGIAVQHAFSYLLCSGPACSRVEYDGFREELDRSGFIAPVHQCPSANCRFQQHRQTLTSPQSQ